MERDLIFSYITYIITIFIIYIVSFIILRLLKKFTNNNWKPKNGFIISGHIVFFLLTLMSLTMFSIREPIVLKILMNKSDNFNDDVMPNELNFDEYVLQDDLNYEIRVHDIILKLPYESHLNDNGNEEVLQVELETGIDEINVILVSKWDKSMFEEMYEEDEVATVLKILGIESDEPEYEFWKNAYSITPGDLHLGMSKREVVLLVIGLVLREIQYSRLPIYYFEYSDYKGFYRNLSSSKPVPQIEIYHQNGYKYEITFMCLGIDENDIINILYHSFLAES